jgi:hypothetical protein
MKNVIKIGCSMLIAMSFAGFAPAQVEPQAREWIDRVIKAYTDAQTFSNVTTIKLMMNAPNSQQMELVQSLRYEYSFKRAAMLNLLRTELSVVEANKPIVRTRILCDGNILRDITKPNEMVLDNPQGAVRIVRDPVQVHGRGSVLLEGLAQYQIETPPDLKFLIGGKAASDHFLKELQSLKVVPNEDKKIVQLQATSQNQRAKVEVLLTIDAETALIKKVKMTTPLKMGNETTQVLVEVECQPKLNPELDDKLFKE